MFQDWSTLETIARLSRLEVSLYLTIWLNYNSTRWEK